MTLKIQASERPAEAEGDSDDHEVILKRPVFLNRNRRKMKQLRKHLIHPSAVESPDGELTVENGLIIRQVPNIRKLQFDSNTEDFLVYKRKKTQDQSVLVKEDYEAQIRM